MMYSNHEIHLSTIRSAQTLIVSVSVAYAQCNVEVYVVRQMLMNFMSE